MHVSYRKMSIHTARLLNSVPQLFIRVLRTYIIHIRLIHIKFNTSNNSHGPPYITVRYSGTRGSAALSCIPLYIPLYTFTTKNIGRYLLTNYTCTLFWAILYDILNCQESLYMTETLPLNWRHLFNKTERKLISSNVNCFRYLISCICL